MKIKIGNKIIRLGNSKKSENYESKNYKITQVLIGNKYIQRISKSEIIFFITSSIIMLVVWLCAKNYMELKYSIIYFLAMIYVTLFFWYYNWKRNRLLQGEEI